MRKRTRKPVTRTDFIFSFHQCGMTYRQATDVYLAMVDVIGTAILSGSPVEFGRVGKIVPVEVNAKPVSMNFPNRRVQIMLGRRLKFKFKVHKAFTDKRQLSWFD